MERSLRILNVEDSPRDSALVLRHLEQAGHQITWERVETADAFRVSLEAKEWDLILCDYSMPRFSAVAALAVLREFDLDIPFIIISGTVGEEIAVAALLNGANDYISKGNLTRLLPAIERELVQAENRRAKRQAEEDRRRSDDRYKALFEYAPDGIIISSPDDYYLDANASMCTMLGYTHQELVGLHASDIVIRSEARQLDSEFALVQSTSDYKREWHFRRKDGTVFPGEVIATIMPDGNLLATIRDITDRKRAEEKLRENESLLSSTQRIAHIGSWVVELSDSGAMVRETWSDEHYRIYGFQPGEIEITHELFLTSIHPDDRERLDAAIKTAIGQGIPFDLEHRINFPDGSERVVHAVAEVVVDPNTGKPTKLLGSVQDITGRTNAEKALMASEERYRSVVETAPDVIVTIDDSNTIGFINPAAKRIFGYTVDELRGASLSMLMPEHLRNRHAAGMKRYQDTGVKRVSWDYVEVTGLHKDGRQIPITISFSEFVQDGRRFFTGIIRDITDRKRAMEALQESEERYRELVENAIDIIYTHDLEGNYTSINKIAETITGYTSEETLTMSMADTVAPEYLEKARQMLAAKLSGNEVTAYEVELIKKDGHRVALEVNTRLVYEGGVAVGVQGIARDISERKRASEEIREKSALLEAQLNSSIDGVLIVDEHGRQIIRNQRFIDLFGMPNHIAEDPDDAKQVQWVTASMKHPDKFVDRVSYLYANPDATSRDEIELTDGTILDRYSAPVRGKDNKYYGRIWTFRDITDRKLADAILRESNEKFHQLADNISDVFWIRSPDMSKIYYISPAYEQIWGRKLNIDYADPDEWHHYILAEDRQRVKAAYAGLTRDESEIEVEFRILRPDGETRWVRARGFQVKDASGEVIRLAGIVTDITDKKLAEEAVRESEIRYRLLFEANPHPMWVYDLETLQFLAVNDAAVAQYGYSREEFMAMTIKDIRPPHQLPKLLQVLKNASGAPTETDHWLHRRKDGSIIDVEITAHELSFAGKRAELVLANDVTERTKAEASLRRAEEKYRGIFENAAEGIFQSTPEGKFLSVNPAMARILGYESPAELIAERTESGSQYYVDRNCRPEIERILSNEGAVVGFECEVLRKDGSRIWIIENIRVVHDESGAVILYEGSLEDITGRKRGEEIQGRRAAHAALRADINAALADSGATLPSTLERCTQAIVQHLNAAFARVWTLNEKENVLELQASAGIYTHIDGPHGKVPVGKFKIGLIAEERRPHTSNDVQNDPRVRDKEWAKREGMIAFAGYPLMIDDRLVGVVAMFTTHTLPEDTLDGLAAVANIMSHGIERRRAENALRASEEQLRQSQKMEAVGVMAGGIAHDFNNLLTAINGYSDLTLRKMPPEEPLRRNIEEVKKAGDRAAELTSQLLAFSRKQVLKPMVHNLNSSIETIEKMLRRIVRENIELRTVLAADLGNIKADPGQIEQVIMNLAVNARDAMPDGGTLTIETRNVYLDDAYVSQKLAIEPGPFTRMTVTDTGIGMDAATQKHIFEPFFTTKDVGKGTGLGLSMVYGIVKQSGGDITVYSEQGHGTTFKIYLPCVDEPIEKPHWSGEHGIAYSGTETILVVEDEEIVRTLVSEILTGSGYVVLEAASGQEALKICSTYKDPIHLLLTDVIMPNMGGSQLKEHVVKLLPEIKVMFMSGYTDDTFAHRSISEANVAFIEKPFTPDALTRKVREELER